MLSYTLSVTYFHINLYDSLRDIMPGKQHMPGSKFVSLPSYIKTGRRKKLALPPAGTNSYYPSMVFKSSSGVLIGFKPNFSTSRLRTFEEINAGSDGPR